MRKIAVLNQKGGVGKTTTVVNTAAALAGMGAKVVVVDLDPQAHLTIHLGLEPQAIGASSYEVLTKEARFEEEILLVRPNLWLLPANINLVGAESELVSVVGRETILREAIESVEDKFDYLVIDCPPSLGLLTLNALAAAEEVLIPLQPHFLALQGFGKLLQTVDLVNKRINPELKVQGILLCMFDTRASLPSEVKADIEQFLESARGTNCAWAQARILPTFIRRNIKLAEAPSYGQTIFEYERNCHGAEDYTKVAESIHNQFQTTPQLDTQPRRKNRLPVKRQKIRMYKLRNRYRKNLLLNRFRSKIYQLRQMQSRNLMPAPNTTMTNRPSKSRQSHNRIQKLGPRN
ncbi:MAG: ParA family protein [Planctomycetota bacterium]|jgi:chromosome partitioning protein